MIIIHVNQHHIKANTADDGNRPVYTLKMPGGVTRYARQVKILGPSECIYDGTRLKCGARAWIQTEGPVELVDEMSYQEAKNG